MLNLNKTTPLIASRALQSYADGNDQITLQGTPFELAIKNVELGFAVPVNLIFEDIQFEVARMLTSPKSSNFIGISSFRDVDNKFVAFLVLSDVDTEGYDEPRRSPSNIKNKLSKEFIPQGLNKQVKQSQEYREEMKRVHSINSSNKTRSKAPFKEDTILDRVNVFSKPSAGPQFNQNTYSIGENLNQKALGLKPTFDSRNHIGYDPPRKETFDYFGENDKYGRGLHRNLENQKEDGNYILYK